MNIGLIISGNLTGFSRFYSNAMANELYSEAKFDFDFRDVLKFIDVEDKVYSISFSANVIAVSLTTRILDSYRRPGVLVVSILMRRDWIVDSAMNPGNKNALYQLLNDINNKFYERNFMNGMINQNAAVLMQDYYSDILSNYRLTADNNQRRINGNIDISTVNKRLGYISATDLDMPSYLSSLYRRSYEGFHHVFFAPNAPQNIDETPEEVIMYRVYITNINMTLPTLVKLTDQIYNLNPNPGEIPFEQNYSYGDVLQGKAGTQIRASIVGETLEISYRFKQEEKVVNFIFEENGNIVSLIQIAPVIVEDDGTRIPLSTESFRFIGKEIYGRKVIQSTNSNYQVKSEYSILDLQRLSDGATCHIQVESCCTFEMRFSSPYDVPKTIKLQRKNSSQNYTIPNVTNFLTKTLPGNIVEWNYTIESKEYQIEIGELRSLQHVQLKPKPVTISSVETLRPVNTGTSLTTQENKATKKGALVLSGGISEVKKEQGNEKKLNIKKVLLVAMPLFVILLYVGISWQFNIWPWNGEKDEEVVVTEEPKSLTKFCTIKLKDCKDDYLLGDDNYKNMRSLKPDEDIKVEVDDNIESEDIRDENTIKYKFIALENCNSDIHFKVTFDGIEVCDSVIQFNNLKDSQDINLKLNVRTSGIVIFKKLSNVESELTNDVWKNLKDGYSKYKNLIKNDKNTKASFNEKLEELYKKVEKNYAPKNEEEKSQIDHDPQTTPNIRTELETLSKLDCTVDEIKAIKNILTKDNRLNKQIDNTTAEKRIEALEGCIQTLRKGYDGKWDPSHENLSNEQAKFIIDIIHKKVETLSKLGKKGTFKNIQSLADFRNIIQERGLITKDSQWYNPNL